MLPAKKTSKARTRTRRAHHALVRANVGTCPECGAVKRHHAACPACGYVRKGLSVPVKG